MKQWHVTYFYLATGMEGRADERDYGWVSADTELEAREIIAKKIVVADSSSSSEDVVKWIMGCLTAEKMKSK